MKLNPSIVRASCRLRLHFLSLICVHTSATSAFCKKGTSQEEAKAYGTRCSQAVPHPSTILARRCLTSVIRRERVCSSWYGRRQLTRKCCPCLCTSCYPSFVGTPQYFPGIDLVSWPTNSQMVQIKNIKLHIVTDIKVNFNSMFGFRISIFGWGVGHFY